MLHAAKITPETGMIIYDALSLVLIEDASTVVITADGKLLKSLEGPATRLAHSLADVSSLVRDVH